MPTGTYLDTLDEKQVEVAHTHTRSEGVPYPTRAIDGRTWHEYFRDIREARQAAQEPELVDDEDEDEPQADITVLEPGRDLTDEEQDALSNRSKIQQVRKRLLAQGWEVRIRRSLVHVAAVLYKSDSKEGDKNEHRKGDVRFEGYDLETLALLGVKRAENGIVGLAVDATWMSKGGYAGATTYDPILGREWRSGYLKARKPNAIELEDGIEPPLSLSDWLAIVAPTPASKKKKEKEEEPVDEYMWEAA